MYFQNEIHTCVYWLIEVKLTVNMTLTVRTVCHYTCSRISIEHNPVKSFNIQGIESNGRMMNFLKSAGPNRKTIHRITFGEKVFCRQYRTRNQPEKIEAVKVRVIGSGSFGDPASLYIRTSDHSKAVFNCGEGTFRLMYAQGFKFKFITNIFCTRSDWDCVGGVPSLARAVYDRCSQFPTLHGPPELESCVEKFAFVTDLDPKIAVNEHSFNAEMFHDDINSQTDFVHLHRDQPRPNDRSVIAYVCRLKSRDSKLDTQKIMNLRLTHDQRHKIHKGGTVTLDNGITITLDDFRTKAFPGANFLVIDVPSKDYLKNLERNEELNLQLDDIKTDNGMEFVAHFAPPEIIETPEYQRFMRRLESKKHFALNQSNSFSGLRWVHKLQYSLNSIDDEIFPLLCSKYDLNPKTYSCYDQIERSETITSDPVVIEPISTFTTYLFPLDESTDKLKAAAAEATNERDDTDDNDDEDGENDEDSEDYSAGDVIINDSLWAQGGRKISAEREKIFPKIIIFGTGSSFPGTTKTATAILVHTSPETSVLLDCGEGTFGQMCRFYGNETAKMICNIKGIFISHMHGDHHMGIMDLLRARQKYMPTDRKALVIMAPKIEFGELLDFYEEKFGNVASEYILIDNADLINSELSDEHKKLMNVINLQMCRTPHTESSFAISMNLNSIPNQKSTEFKLMFSGDATPCNEMVELGRNSDLLIHEATLEDTLASSAATKKHSTVTQAIEQGRAMNAKYTLLTHFSQRYRNLLPIADNLLDSSIGVAFDNMEIVPTDLPRLNELYLKLKEFFKDEVEWNERRSVFYDKKYNSSTDIDREKENSQI